MCNESAAATNKHSPLVLVEFQGAASVTTWPDESSASGGLHDHAFATQGSRKKKYTKLYYVLWKL